METKSVTEVSTSAGWYCQNCGVWVLYGTYHSCTYNPNQYNYNYNYCVCCPQFQKLNQLLERLEALMKKIEEKQK